MIYCNIFKIYYHIISFFVALLHNNGLEAKKLHSSLSDLDHCDSYDRAQFNQIL